MGHSMSDPVHGHYRTKAEVEEQRRHDPIKVFIATLESLGVVSPQDIEELNEKVRDAVEDAVAFSERSEEPEPLELHTDVYAP